MWNAWICCSRSSQCSKRFTCNVQCKVRCVFCWNYPLHAVVLCKYSIIGRGPFDAKSFSSILAKNKEADVDFSHKNLSRASPECFDLLKKMLNTNPDERLSAAECLAHHFLSEPEDVYMSLPSVEEGIGVKIKEFQCK